MTIEDRESDVEVEDAPINSPSERYKELLLEPGIGESKAWHLLCDESEWWNPAREKIRDLAFASDFSRLTSLRLAECIMLTNEASNSLFTYYRDSKGEFVDCLLNPWTIMQKIRGYHLASADKFARAQSIPLNSPDRLREVIIYALERALNNFYKPDTRGDTHASLREVEAKFNELTLDVNLGDDAFDVALDEAIEAGRLVEIPLMVQKPGMQPRQDVRLANSLDVRAEKDIAVFIRNGSQGTRFHFDEPHVSLDAMQERAYYAAAESRLTVVDASPGFGKTHTIAAIVQTALGQHVAVAVGAYMGRAVSRVASELEKMGINRDANSLLVMNTLHSIFRVDHKTSEAAGFSGDNGPSGIFIIDEASMVPTRLLATVMRSLPPNWNLVLMGDNKQLPPIEAGLPFNDIIQSDTVPVIRLGTCYRTSKPDMQRALVALCSRSSVDSTDNFRVFKRTHEQAYDFITETVIKTAQDLKCDPTDLLIVTPQNRTKSRAPVITTSDSSQPTCLNKVLKKALNFENCSRQWWEPAINDRVFASGRANESANSAHRIKVGNDGAVHQRAYNGELGTVVGDKNGITQVAWDGRENKPEAYSAIEAHGKERILQLAYAISVHKVQGAEAAGVIFIVDANGWSMLSNAIAYTACSRGKERVVAISVGKDKYMTDGFTKAVRTANKKRATLLPHYLRDEI